MDSGRRKDRLGIVVHTPADGVAEMNRAFAAGLDPSRVTAHAVFADEVALLLADIAAETAGIEDVQVRKDR
jgi:hypothetical protein